MKFVAGFASITAFLMPNLLVGAESSEAIVERVGEDIKYLASEELEGRGVKTKGIHLAADFIISEYKKAGLKPGMPDGTWKQTFDVALGKMKIKDETSLRFTDASGAVTNVAVGTFQPLQRGVNGRAKGELFFVGYGITSEEDKYDEYADVDVAGKILVMIRREPRQGEDGESFKGKETSEHSYIDRKLELAAKHKAAGIVFVNDPHTANTPSTDELSPPSGFGSKQAGIPFVHVRQSIINKLLTVAPLKVGSGDTEKSLKSLTEVAAHIDKTLVPVSQPLGQWSAEVVTQIDADSVEAHNLIGVWEGEGDLSDETIVVGAHYDHLGYGGFGSRAKNRTGEIHFGADDNATGTAAVLEIIRRVTAEGKTNRRIVFICFSGEERGLLGSRHYVSAPVFPLEKTVAMLNYDMIGTLRNNKIDVNGVGTAAEFRPIVEAADEASPLEIKVVEHPYAGSDHLPFFQKNIPVMFCFTGITPRYHTPDDKFEVINVPGVVSVIDYTESLLRGIDALPTAPTFQSISRNSRRTRIPYLGVIPNLGADGDEPGVPIQSVRSGSPAKTAGIKVGDAILKMDEKDVSSHSDLIQFLKGKKQGNDVILTLQRGETEVQVKVRLGAPR